MSLFLAYFETGRPVAPSPLPQGLYAYPFVVRFKGSVNRARQAMMLNGMAASDFLSYGSHSIALEGEKVRGLLRRFLTERLTTGAYPHFVFLWIGGRLEDGATIDGDHVVRLPIRMLDEKLRAMARFPIVDSSEVVEVIADTEDDAEVLQPATPSRMLVDISSENAASEPDPMRWNGNIDMLVDDTLFSIGQGRGSILVLPSLNPLAEAIGRLRQGSRVVATTLSGDTSSLRFVRTTSGGIHAASVAYRGVKSTAVPVAELDTACGDAVRRFLTGLSPEQSAALKREQAAKLLGFIGSIWPWVNRPT